MQIPRQLQHPELQEGADWYFRPDAGLSATLKTQPYGPETPKPSHPHPTFALHWVPFLLGFWEQGFSFQLLRLSSL